MTAAKQITLTLDDEELAWAEERAAKEARTVEDVVREAIREHRRTEARAKYFQEGDLEDLTLEGIKEALRELRGEKKVG